MSAVDDKQRADGAPRHTPGPWEVSETDTFGTRVRVATPHLHPQSGHLGARMYLHAQIALCREVTPGAADANACLIAAAPDLLALAKQYASECAHCDGTGLCTITTHPGGIEVDNDDQPCQDCADIRAVIDRAEGRP